MSELTDKLRREGLRPSIVSKIDWLMDDLETEVADVIREALLNKGETLEWVNDAITEQRRVYPMLCARAEDIQSRLRKAAMENYADEIESLIEQASDLLIEDPY